MARKEDENDKKKEKFLTELMGKITKRTDFTCEYLPEKDCIWVKTKDGLIGDKACHYEVIFHGENEAETENLDVPSVEVHFEDGNFRDFQNISLPEGLIYSEWFEEFDRRIVYKDRAEKENNSHKKIIDKLIELERLIGVELRNVVSRELADDKREALLETLALARNPDAVKAALQSSKYKCENKKVHTSFTDKTSHNYVEGHHLIPMSKETYFDKSLNQAANIVFLCPNCHREIHYGMNRQALVKTLLTPQRQKDLSSAGLNVTLKKLQSYY